MKYPWQVLCIAFLISSLTLGGCAPTAPPDDAGTDTTTTTTPSTPTTTVNEFATYTPRLEGMATVEMVVNGASIIIELNGTDAPITAGNFADLVERGVYDGLAFHRVIREPNPFVAQGGDPVSKDPNVPIEQLGRGGFTEPETGTRRDLPLEIKLTDRETPVYGRANLNGTKVVLKHDKGAIAMARSQAPNSASSQFYFTLADSNFLDGNYAVFGKVTEGIEVVDAIQLGDRIESAKLIEGADLLVR